MQSKVAGLTFRKTSEPPGVIAFEREPNNQYDSNAIKVLSDGVHIGYIPKGEGQTAILDELSAQRTINVQVSEHKFFDEEKGWNQENIGNLQYLLLDLDLHIGYEKDGREYVPITKLLNYLNPDGEIDGLIRWACDAGSYDKYKEKLNKAAERGTAVHKAIELQLKAGLEPVELPGYHKKRRFISAETTVFDDSIGVACQVDAIYEDRTADWKTSSRVRMDHRLQAAFQAKNCGKKIAEVVKIGAPNKQTFSVTTLDKAKIEEYYEVVVHLKKIYDIIHKKRKDG